MIFGKNNSNKNPDKLLIQNLVKNNINSNALPLNENKIDYSLLVEKLADYFILNNPNLINAVDKGLLTDNELSNKISLFLNAYYGNKFNDEQKQLINKLFYSRVFGWSDLQEIIDDDDITDIKVIDYDNIRIKKFGKRSKSKVKFRSRDSMIQFIKIIAERNSATINELNSILKLTDTTSSDKFIFRINITSSFINSVHYPYLIIRKIPKTKYSLAELENKGMFNKDIYNYLETGIKSGLSFLIIGKGAAGKTFLLNALIDEIPFDKSGLVIQEAEELFTKVHPDLMFQKVRYIRGDSKIQYTLKDLSINGLLLDLDYYIIGEIKGDEAIDFVNASYTGHSCLATIHGGNCEEGTNKLVHYMKYCSDMKRSELLEMLTSIDSLIFLKDFKICEVTEIKDFDYNTERLNYNNVFKFDFKDNKYIKLNESCKKVKDKINYANYKAANF